MIPKEAIINSVVADLCYAVENLERLGEYLEVDQKQLETAIKILRESRVRVIEELMEEL